MAGAGQRRNRLTFQRRTSPSVTRGAQTVTYPTLAVVWGRVVPRSAAEGLQAERLANVVTYDVEILWSETMATVRAQDRFMWKGRTYEIEGPIDTDERRKYLRMTAREATS